MKKTAILLITLLVSLSCVAGEVVIYDKSFIGNPKSLPVPAGFEGHGTHIANIIRQLVPSVEIHEHVLENSDQLVGAITMLATSTTKRVVVNMSFVSPNRAFCPELLQRTIKFATDRGVIFVAAAGNHNILARGSPALCENVIVVGAASDGAPTEYTNYGDNVIGYAPEPTLNNSVYKGTSYTAPVVTAVISRWLDQEPNLTLAQIRTRLSGYADERKVFSFF